MTYSFLATAAFGLEGVASGELKRMGLEARGENGGARFVGEPMDAFRANLCLRTADRVLMILAEKPARSFEELFQLVKGIAWERLMSRNAAIHVSGKCVRSQLMSVRDCQAITKKAIVQRLGQQWHMDRLPENGPVYPVEVAVVNDTARITLDMSGDALNRRGYRTWNGEAPIRETLAAALVTLSPWKKDQMLWDPCCGTGTILIEAAYLRAHRAPGLTRSFACESWIGAPRAEMNRLRAQAEARFDPSLIGAIGGSDIDPEALKLCKRHLQQAGLGGRVTVMQKDLRQLQLDADAPLFLLNPPYGERLSDRKQCEGLYRALRELRDRHPGSDLAVITAHTGFERCFGQRARQKRRLYNGRLECEYLIY